jgi:serine/threonine protein phosphatase PrpC
MFITFKARERGFSHIQKGMPCQDAAACYPVRPKPSVGFAAVADGHGGAKYFRSDTGSHLAVRTAERELQNFHKCFFQAGPDKPAPLDASKIDGRLLEKNIVRIEQDIIRRWREAVEKHARDNPWTESELAFCAENKIALPDTENLFSVYGTTLVAALAMPDFWFATQIGDGLCVVLDQDGKPRAAIPPDEEQGFGYTNSICAANAAEKFQRAFAVYAGSAPISGITVATDGVADSFTPDDYLAFTAELRKNFIRTPKDTAKELQAYLATLSERGSRDDCAIAGIFRVEKQKEAQYGKEV